jgi:NAD(P)-dependent dehydrogenase (short-subunit alcohol dehydrogenase family)
MRDGVAWISGGARGLGLGFAEMLLAQGVCSHVTIADVDGEGLLEAAEALKRRFGAEAAFASLCDVTDSVQLQASLESVWKRRGRLTLVVNNAGIATALMERADLAVRLNLLSVIEGTRIAGELAERGATGGGAEAEKMVVVNVASSAGFYPLPFAPVYSATKAAVVMFSRAAAQLLAPRGARVTALCPTFARTRMVTEPLEAGDDVFAEAVRRTGGVMEVDVVARALLRLVQDDALVGVALLVSPKGEKVFYDTSAAAKPKL